MTRYIDAEKFKQQLEIAMKKMHLIGGVKGVDVGAVIKALDMQPTADVVPRAELERLLKEIRALSAFKDYFSDLYGQGLEIAKWHLNGDTEPFDSFYDSALDEYDAAFLSERINDETASR